MRKNENNFYFSIFVRKGNNWNLFGTTVAYSSYTKNNKTGCGNIKTSKLSNKIVSWPSQSRETFSL